MQQFLEASPVSRAQLEALGLPFRRFVGCETDRYLPVERIIEHSLPTIIGDEYVLDVLDADEMGSRHGYMQVSQRRLALRADVYEGVVEGRGRDRMTAIHEVAHLILHPDRSLSRTMSSVRPPAYRDPEWQAKCLAGAIMMPAPLMLGMTSVRTIGAEFGVSPDAAAYRAKQLRMEVGR